MQKIVLPCSKEEQPLPFVTDGGLLPCPCLSTCVALKWLQQDTPERMKHANDFARSQMQKIWTHGVQVEWLGCASLLEWQLHVESSSVQASVVVLPHVIDTALKFLTFCNSRQASSEDASEQTLDQAFQRFLPGQSIHRFTAAKTLLCSTEPAVIAELAKWRKRAHYLHANGCANPRRLRRAEQAMLQARASASSQGHSLTSLELLKASNPPLLPHGVRHGARPARHGSRHVARRMRACSQGRAVWAKDGAMITRRLRTQCACGCNMVRPRLWARS